jgi:predicted HTH domain antitoxin
MPHVSFEIPDDLLLTLREQPAELSQEMRLVTAIHYLREKRLSLGQAARFAGVNRLDFLDVLASRGVPAFDLSDEDAAAEIAAAQRATPSDDRQ